MGRAAVTNVDLIRTVYDAYSSHFNGKDRQTWPMLRLVAIQCEATSALSEKDAKALADTHEGNSGWVRYRSALWSRDNGKAEWSGDREHAGPPLAAEWVIDNSTSLHLRADPTAPGLFATWSYGERPCADDNPRGRESLALRQRVVVLAHGVRPDPEQGAVVPTLVYHVYWGADSSDESAMRRLCYRFAGFEQSRDRVASLRHRTAGRTS